MNRHMITKRAALKGLGSLLAGASTFALAGPSLAQPRTSNGAPLYKDANAPVDARVDDLLSRMTLEEKVQQITTVWRQKREIFDEQYNFSPERLTALYPIGIGHMARPSDRQGSASLGLPPSRTARETIDLVNAVQRFHIEQTRLGIPVLFHEEALHGHSARDATSFPQSIALASTWDPELVERIFTIVGREVRARGVHMVLAPVVDVTRDPRWGRIEETYGEDPFLVGEIGIAAINGFQGPALPLADGRVFATLKHMTGHGQPESGTNIGPAQYAERTLRENFFPPFEAAVTRTNIMSVMASYNEIDGVPSHANPWLLNDILRGEWGFDGVVVSDYFAIEELQRVHHVAEDFSSAAVRALRSGVDLDLPNGDSFATLTESVRAGRVSEAEVDVAVRRMLKLKFLSGMFEAPYADADYADSIIDNDEARALAEEAARKSIVLLKNDGALPLDAGALRTLAVIGPNANVTRLGGYSNVPRRTINVLEGIQARLGEGVRVVHHEGVRLTNPVPSDWGSDDITQAPREENLRLIREAARAARRADAIVLVIGGSSAESREAWSLNHLGDRASIELLGEQEELAEAMFNLGKPVIVVLINGRPQSISENIRARAHAIVEGWYLGQEAGTAMAQVLFGDANPGGKLPVTIARHAGQLPHFYNSKPSARRGYLFEDHDPLYPFGFGLSYTSFEISLPRLSADTIAIDAAVDVSVDVRNTGARAGDEVVQIYVRDLVSSVTRPLKELKAFKRVTLQPGETTTVTLRLDSTAFRFWDADMARVVEPGQFEIMAGPNSVDLQKVTLTVV